MENSFKFGKRCGHLQSLQNDFCYKLCTQCAILFLYQVSLLFLLTERQNTVFLTKIKIIQHLPQSRLHFKLLEIYFLEPKSAQWLCYILSLLSPATTTGLQSTTRPSTRNLIMNSKFTCLNSLQLFYLCLKSMTMLLILVLHSGNWTEKNM